MSVSDDKNLTDLPTLKGILNIGIADIPKDTELQGFINRASATFIGLMNRKYFISASRVEVFRGNDRTFHFPEAQPITAVTSILQGTTSIPAALNTYSYGFRFDARSIRLFGDLFFSDEEYTLNYTGGYTTTSIESLQAEQAVLSLVNLWYKRKAHQDEISRSLGQQITAKYIETAIPEETKLIANQLKRVV